MGEVRFSYSKLNTYDKSDGGCPFKYKLIYEDNHFIDSSTIATEFGTLVHFVEETIANDIKANNNEPYFMMDDQKYIDIFINGFTPPAESTEKSVAGILKLKEKYSQDFYTPDKSGMDYNEKASHYLNNGVYFLRDFLNKNRNLVVLDTEKEFNVVYKGYTFHGFIDRVLKDTQTGDIIVEDIKTWANADKHDLVTPLQFVFYTLAATELYGVPQEKVSCYYYLPFQMERYPAGTKGFINRGLKKIDKLLGAIESHDYTPNPTPLCHWCVFSKTYPNQPEEAKNLCPYYSNWTKENRDFSTNYDWMGPEHHAIILDDFISKNNLQAAKKQLREVLPSLEAPPHTPQSTTHVNERRFFLIRR